MHEILQKSSGGKGSRRVYQLRYIGCVCALHHIIGIHSTSATEADRINAKMLLVMKTRYGYKYPKKLLTFMKSAKKADR